MEDRPEADKFQAEWLLELLLKNDVSGKKIWMPRALKARNLIISKLENAGAEVKLTPVYQNVIPHENREILKQTLDRRNIDWITFTSSSTVTNFFKILNNPPLHDGLPKLASIGILTTGTLKDWSLEPQFTADPQNLEGLCNGIINWEKNH